MCAHPQCLQLLDGCVLLLRCAEQAPQSSPRPAKLLPQADDLAKACVHKLRDRQQPQRVARRGGVKDDAAEARILLGSDELHHLAGRSSKT